MKLHKIYVCGENVSLFDIAFLFEFLIRDS
jgi:hypothetical protein